jgi:hypothetical protein
MSLREAVTLVKSARPVVQPNCGFMRRLVERSGGRLPPNEDDVWIQDLFLHPGSHVLTKSSATTVVCENGLKWQCEQVIGTKNTSFE